MSPHSLQMPFDAHAPDLPGAFHVFTSCIDGHASKIFGAHCVRECRGSLQLWQCGAAAGPCRSSDVWEAPSGYTFRLRNDGESESGKGSGGYGSSSDDSASDDDCPPPVPAPCGAETGDTDNGATAFDEPAVAPAGPPASKPPVHLVPMWKPQCMDGALSAAAAFFNNHPRCRTCARSYARPALQLGGDCNWSDLEERRDRYTRWKACVQKVARARAVEGGDAQGLRVVVLEVGSSFSSPPEISGSVRRESEAFVASLNASGRGKNVATLVRVSEDYPLPERREGEGLAEEAVIPILMSATSALTAIDSELGHLEARRG
jgi:hypothetical protein